LIENGKIEARPTNWLTPVALVLLREESSHGYELMERLAEFGFEEINPGTMYRTLRRMEQEDLCKSTWETAENGPARRMYLITGSGEAYLASWAEGCEKCQLLMAAFFRAYTIRQDHAPERDVAS
jgi:PadR family transcriptional regulator, regulatory protein PadR